jgi:hypothetical protein
MNAIFLLERTLERTEKLYATPRANCSEAVDKPLPDTCPEFIHRPLTALQRLSSLGLLHSISLMEKGKSGLSTGKCRLQHRHCILNS